MSLVTANLVAVDTFSGDVAHSQSDGDICAVITGTFVGTAALQMSVDGGLTWANLSTTTAPVTLKTPFTFGALYRVYCTAYTSGTIVVKLL